MSKNVVILLNFNTSSFNYFFIIKKYRTPLLEKIFKYDEFFFSIFGNREMTLCPC